jgi:hypothetical protein
VCWFCDYLDLSLHYWAHRAIIRASKDSVMSKHDTSDKRKHETLNYFLESWNKWETWKWQKPKRDYCFVPHWIINSLWYKETEGLFTVVYDTKWKCEGFFKQQLLKEPKLAQLDRVLCMWFTAVRTEGKVVAWPMLIGKAKSFCDEMKITDKCTFLEDSNNKTGNACRT